MSSEHKHETSAQFRLFLSRDMSSLFNTHTVDVLNLSTFIAYRVPWIISLEKCMPHAEIPPPTSFEERRHHTGQTPLTLAWPTVVFLMPDRSLCDVIYYTINSCQPLVGTDNTKDYSIELMRHSVMVPRDPGIILPARPSGSILPSAGGGDGVWVGGISMLPRGTSNVLSELPRHRTYPTCICLSEPDRVAVLTPTRQSPPWRFVFQLG